MITLKRDPINSDEQLDCNAGEPFALSVPWSKSPVRRRKELLSNESNTETHRSMRTETRARLLKGIAQGRIWLNQLVNDQSSNTNRIATVQSLSERSVRSTISLAFLAPDIVEAAINGDLPRGITVSQLTDLPSDWQDQRRTLGLI